MHWAARWETLNANQLRYRMASVNSLTGPGWRWVGRLARIKPAKRLAIDVRYSIMCAQFYDRHAMKLALFICVVLCVSVSCSRPEQAPPQVLASIRPLTLLVTDLLAGTETDAVYTLLPGNADPHNYSLRVSDRKALQQARLIVWVGPDMERSLARPLARRASDTLQLMTLPGLHWPADDAHGDDGHVHGARDPHLWLDPHNVERILHALAEELIAILPQHASRIQSNLRNMQEGLAEFVRVTRDQLSPIADRSFAIHHDSLGHFVERFQLNQAGAVNVMPEEILSARQLDRLREQVGGASCLLVEQDSDVTRRLASVLQLPLMTVDPLATSPATGDFLRLLESIRDSIIACLRQPPVVAG